MNGALADAIGLVGSAIFVAGFAYANYSVRFDKLIFNVINLIGAILLLVSLSVHFNLAAFVLEIVWAAIAIFGIFQGVRERLRRKQS